MRFYQTTTEFNCGIDLHTRQMYVCVMDRQGHKLLHTNVRGNDFDYFLKRVDPWREDMTVVAECTFNWYWLADACEGAGLPFVLGHALYLKAIHGGKNKNDRIDSEKLAHLLRSNLIPPAHVYPAEKRPIRALLRRRMNYVWKRAELLGHLTCSPYELGEQPVSQCQHRVRDRWFDKLRPMYRDPMQLLSAEADMHLIKEYDRMIDRIERAVLKHTHKEHCKEYNLLKTIPGIGKVLALTILYEMDSISRFPTVKDFSSYCRLVKGSVASAGKLKGLRGGKLGNPYLKWAFRQAAVICKRDQHYVGKLAKKLEAKHPKPVANSILANKLARAVYFMLRDGKGFDPKRLVATA